MAIQRIIECPICGSNLLFSVRADSSLSHKVNKDGTLEEELRKGPRYVTDNYYLECSSGCDFVYNLSYDAKNEIEYSELDDWYRECADHFADRLYVV